MNEDNLNNSLEVSLIGTGGGYGESIVLNLGNNDWIVVDSCQDPFTKKSLPLEYLKSLKVNISEDVKLIICTHWHDDHILGISNLLNECDTAKFCMASATDKNKFLLMVGLDSKKAENESSLSSTKELSQCIEIIRKKGLNILTAVQDRILYMNKTKDISSYVYSLSPSDYILEQFNIEISSLISDFSSSNRKIICESPNDKSVALLIKINDQGILLGSDLEVSNDNKKGWLCVLDNCKCIDSKASIYKIPHHGSKNGFHERIWDELVNRNAISKLTPWNRGDKLPTKEMLKKYREFTDNLYITSYNFQERNKPKKREKRIAKVIERFNKTLNEERYHYGIVRCRLNLSDTRNEWNVELIDKALQITDEFIIKN